MLAVFPGSYYDSPTTNKSHLPGIILKTFSEAHFSPMLSHATRRDDKQGINMFMVVNTV